MKHIQRYIIAGLCGYASTAHTVSDVLINHMKHNEPVPSGLSYQGQYTPAHLAFLDTIAHAEGTVQLGYDGYYAQYPNRNFDGPLSDHPRQINGAMYKNQELRSSAAGRYQFLTRTWDRCVQKLNLKDFSPINQDLGALMLLDECNILSMLSRPEFNITEAIEAANKVWASLPGSPYGQPMRPMDQLHSIFYERLMYYDQIQRKNKSRRVRRHREWNKPLRIQ